MPPTNPHQAAPHQAGPHQQFTDEQRINQHQTNQHQTNQHQANQHQIDAIELLLADLNAIDPHLQHRASFQSCWQELSQLRGELVTLLLSRRRLVREAASAARTSL